MAGLRKAKKYDWKDSNLALFGSDTERQVKKESAETEPAWKGVGQGVGLRIWRIVKFKVTDWPKEDYGSFYSGDSYIVLNTYKNEGEDELLYDVHFWIGAESTQDEYGTAAYKTVELDTFLDDKPIQHREVQSCESDLFKSYFAKTGIQIMKGGAESGFRHVKPEEYRPRLLHFCGTRKAITVTEVPLARSRVKSDDVFILDLGLQIYQFNGKGASKDEKFKAAQFLNDLKSKRSKSSVEVLEEDQDDLDNFYQHLTQDDEEDEQKQSVEGKELYQLSDASGKMTFNKVKTVDIIKDDFKSEDVFLLNTPKELFVWVGKGASANEKKNGLSYAHSFLTKSNNPLAPVTVLKEGQTSYQFEVALTA